MHRMAATVAPEDAWTAYRRLLAALTVIKPLMPALEGGGSGGFDRDRSPGHTNRSSPVGLSPEASQVRLRKPGIQTGSGGETSFLAKTNDRYISKKK